MVLRQGSKKTTLMESLLTENNESAQKKHFIIQCLCIYIFIILTLINFISFPCLYAVSVCTDDTFGVTNRTADWRECSAPAPV